MSDRLEQILTDIAVALEHLEGTGTVGQADTQMALAKGALLVVEQANLLDDERRRYWDARLSLAYNNALRAAPDGPPFEPPEVPLRTPIDDADALLHIYNAFTSQDAAAGPAYRIEIALLDKLIQTLTFEMQSGVDEAERAAADSAVAAAHDLALALLELRKLGKVDPE